MKDLKPQDFEVPKELTTELTACALAVHDLFDNGMSLDEMHDFVEAVFETNMNEFSWWMRHNGRMND